MPVLSVIVTNFKAVLCKILCQKYQEFLIFSSRQLIQLYRSVMLQNKGLKSRQHEENYTVSSIHFYNKL